MSPWRAQRAWACALACALAGCAGATPVARDAAQRAAPPQTPEQTEAAAPASPAPPLRAARARQAPPPRADAAARRRAAAELAWLSPSHVGAAVRAHHDEFQACQALGDLESRREDGAVTLGWLVLPDGSVNEVTVGPTTFRNASVNACVLQVARQVTFPRSQSPTHISWTLEFRGASSHAPIATAR